MTSRMSRLRNTLLCLLLTASCVAFAQEDESRSLSLDDLRDKIRGGLAGQMAGVTYGAPTEFRWLGKMVEGDIKWTPSMIKGALNQDDLYVEMTFIEVMDRIGLNATTEQYGDAFRDSKYNLWHANAGARRLLNSGIKAPMSGHPKYNLHANDIDFQIEADFIGLMSPGMPQMVIRLCDRVGRVMNYGDGVYGGMFVCGMYAEAFFESDSRKLVEAGVQCMPEGSGYRAIIEDCLALYDKYPDDWTETWRQINAKWDKHDSCPDGSLNVFNIDARLNGAYIAIGMLYGDGDFDKTLEISTRCGQDSDCNPASAAGILGVVQGFDALDKKWVGVIDEIQDEKFNYTAYSFNDMVASTEQRVMAAVKAEGGTVGDNSISVPKTKPVPPALEQWSMGVPTRAVLWDDPAWEWKGKWKDEPFRSYRERAAKQSEHAGDTVELAFNGSAISIVGNMSGAGGRADVFLDGEPAGQIDAYIIERTTDSNLWHRYDLEDGPHTLKIVTLKKSDPRSSGKKVRIHRAVVYGPE